MSKKNSIDSINTKLIDIIAKRLKIKPSKISPHFQLSKLGADSFQILEIIYDIEVTFQLEQLASDDFYKTKTIHDIANMINHYG